MSNQELNSFFKRLTNHQKWSLVGLIVLGVVIFAMWFVDLKKNIVYPIYGGRNPQEITNNNNNDNPDLVTAELEAIKKKTDTDKDGLSDWDEENVYKTSAFLPDTDGDGINDGIEIKNGQDPNCPEGQECFAGQQVNTNVPSTETNDSQAVDNSNTSNNSDSLNNSTTSGVVNTNNSVNPVDTGKLSPGESEMIKQVFGSNPDAAKIRQILLESGVSQSDLDKVTDEQLISTFNSLQ